MKNDKHEQNELQRMMEGRAARMIAAAVTVFLCVLTLFEFVALKMEWNVPALAVLSGDNGLWTREYQREELVMDGSTENILLADDGETPLTGSGENAKTNVGENGSGGTAQTFAPPSSRRTRNTCGHWQKRCGRKRLRRRM